MSELATRECLMSPKIPTESDEKSDFRLSYTNVRQKGMIPNTEYIEQNFDLNTSRKLSDKFTVRASAKFKLAVSGLDC